MIAQNLIKNIIMHSTNFIAVPLLLSSGAQAWGTLGHATVAQIADNYLTPAAKTYVQGILGSGVTMASVASWADNFRYTTAGKFSAPYQYATGFQSLDVATDQS